MNFDKIPSGPTILPRQPLQLQLEAHKLAVQWPIHYCNRSKAESAYDCDEGNHTEYHKES